MLVYGRNTTLQALNSSLNVSRVFLEENIRDDRKISEIKELTDVKQVKIEYVTRDKLSKITESKEHQGVATEIEFKYSSLRELTENENTTSLIYISEATFEHNVGAIIRTAECLGFHGVIIPTNIQITPVVAKISTGAVFSIPIVRISIYQAIKELKESGFFVTGIERGGENYFNLNLSDKQLLIIGGEDKSLSQSIVERCDQIAEIPQFGKTNSLNMSVAAGIIMAEHRKQNTLADKF